MSASPESSAPGPWSEQTARKGSWLAPVGVGTVVVAATAYVAVLDPNTSHAFPICPLRAFTGIDCPACGALRATFALSRGDLIQAADHNLLFVLAVPLAFLAYAGWLARSLGVEVPRLRAPARAATMAAVVAVAFMVLRNLPVDGLSFLDSAAG